VSITGRRHTTRRPCFPAFTVPTTGFSSCGVNDDNRAACNLHAALFDLIYPPVVGGISCGDNNNYEAVCNLHTALIFFLFPPALTKTTGWHDIHMPPAFPFVSLPTGIGGGLASTTGQRDRHTLPSFPPVPSTMTTGQRAIYTLPRLSSFIPLVIGGRGGI
jgi:hypothetical protein